MQNGIYWEDKVSNFYRIGEWDENLGPPPGRTGCQAPDHVLLAYGYPSANFDIIIDEPPPTSPNDPGDAGNGHDGRHGAKAIGDAEGGAGRPAEAGSGDAKIRFGLWTRCAADVTPRRVDTIWSDKNGGVRLARGEHTLIAGVPGLGKSQIATAMAAACTTGGDWPCGEGRAPIGRVIFLAAEDSVEHTLVPRLMAAGADRDRVLFIEGAVTKNGKGRRTFNFQADYSKLRALLKKNKDVVLVIIDPVTAYMGNIDGHKNTEVRGVLAPLGELAQQCNVAIASITHFSKGTRNTSTKAIDRIIGSIAFIAAPRIGLTVIADSDDSERRLLLHVKNNLGRPPQGLAFRLEQHRVGQDEKGDFVGSSITWESEPVQTTADEALGSGNTEPTAKEDAVEFLRVVLAHGPVKVSDIEAEAKEAGLLGASQPIGQSKPFRSARKELRIEPYQPKAQTTGGWFWALPGHHVPSNGSDALQNDRASDGAGGYLTQDRRHKHGD